MADKLTQQMFSFSETASGPRPESHVEAARYQPSQESLDAIERLTSWLTNPRTGKMTASSDEIVAAVRKVLVEGKNSYFHYAEDMLEALAIRNGRTHGDDIPAGVKAVEGGDFQQTIEDLLDCLHEQLVAKGKPR